MEFRMVYRGPLPANREQYKHHARMVETKHQIRTALHPQIKESWMSHPAMRIPGGPFSSRYTERGISFWEHYAEQHKVVSKSGHIHRFAPLITEQDYYGCAINILFLRRDVPGVSLVHKGDIDNRIKILFDALRMPEESQEVYDSPQPPEQNPCFCLVKDDKYIDHVSVTTDRLLAQPEGNESKDDVFIVIHVVARVVDFERSFSPV